MFKIQNRIAVIAIFIMSLCLLFGCRSSEITGEWIYKGEIVEFLSDGVIFYEGCSDMYPPTYEITEEGYLKIGIYDYAWVTYEYTYFIVDNDGDTLTLTDKSDAERVYVLERSDSLKDGEGNDNLIQTDEEKALVAIEKYFEAYNDMNLEAIHNASFPKGFEMNSWMVCETEYDFFYCWARVLGMNRSLFDGGLDMTDIPNFVVYRDYPMVYADENGDLLDCNGEKLTLEEVLPNFSISYDIIEIKPYEECTVYYRDGMEYYEFGSMDKIVPGQGEEYLDIDNMYVAQVKVEYYYGDDLYGYNKDWWNDETFCEYNHWGSYEETIEDAFRESVLFIYEYDGDWYVYPIRWRDSGYTYKVEF